MAKTDSKNPQQVADSNGIWAAPFQGLLWTQALTATNDNVFRWFVIGIGKTQFQPEQYPMLLTLGLILFTVPYILFASIAGWLADRFSKRRVILGCKIAEIIIMTAGVAAVGLLGEPDPNAAWTPAFVILMVVVFFMGVQSALFAPAKVGTIPELLNEEQISAGNGIFALTTLTATIIGTGLGGLVADETVKSWHAGNDKITLAAVVMIGIAVVGTGLALLVKSLPAANKSAKFPTTIVGETLRDVIALFRSGPLLPIALGIAFFWTIAGNLQLNIDSLTEQNGGMMESHRTPLLIAVTVGIGIGSVFAGYVSAGRIELGLVGYGALGIALFCILLSFAPRDFIAGESMVSVLSGWKMIAVCLLLIGLGFSAGLFDVPLASYLQHNSPIESRGAILSATNCVAFSGMLLLCGFLYLMQTPTHPGSLSNISAELTRDGLSPDNQEKLDILTADFEFDWNNADKDKRPSVKSFVAKAPEEIRAAAISNLILFESQRKRENGEPVAFTDYDKDFPEDKKHVKKVFVQSGKLPLLSARQLFLMMGLMTIPIIAYAAYRLPQAIARIAFLWLFKLLYRVKVTGLENIPEKGGAILVSNHTSFLDGAILLTFIPRRVRAIAWAGNFKNRMAKKWANFCGVILITGGPKSIQAGLQEARKALGKGQLVAIFPEGGISRTGQVRTFKPGLMKILEKMPAPVIPVYIDELWGSIFSHYGRKVFTKFPNSFRRPLSLHIGKPIEEKCDSMFPMRQAVQQLGATVHHNYAGKFNCPAALFVKQCKKAKFRSKIADSSGQEEKGGSLLTRALVLRRLLRKHVLDANEKTVGVLIPPSVGGAIVNLSLGMDNRVAVNLNYSLSEELINYCIKDAGIKRVLTSRKVAEKLGFENLAAEVYYLDDLKEKVSGMDKAIGALQSYVIPGSWVNWSMGLGKVKPDDLMTIVYTSGSTGTPKGVMLSQRNVGSNMAGIERAGSFHRSDTMIGVLPFFHSFGYTATLWAAMAYDIRAAYHFSPLDTRQVGKLTKKFGGTMLVATPTFLRSYMRRCSKEEFKTLNMIVAGAERLPAELVEQFNEKYGVKPVEGYGATELSPIVCVNIPKSRDFDTFQTDRKDGTVGRPMPNVAAKVTDLDTGETLGANESGMLWITGPNVMQGYLNLPDKTAEVIQNGWYKTGDVALIDDDGFIKITGRMSRFSKIGGEMVPHLKIEEILTRMCDETPDDQTDDQPNIAVTAVPDPKKGEKLIVLHTAIHKTVDELRAGLKEAGLPNIFIPSADSFRQVEELPLLGSGKLDLKGIKQRALELFPSDS